MYIDIQNRLRSARFIMDFFFFILCIVVFSAAGACSTNRRVIKNETLYDWDDRQLRYKNLHPPKYGSGEETEYDRVDFLKAQERKPHKYQFLIDPVLEQWDGLAGKLAKYTAIETANAKSPLTAEDLPFANSSEKLEIAPPNTRLL